MKKRRIVKIAALLIGLLLILVTIVLLYLNFADLSGWRDTVAGLVSDTLGREFKIGGEFTPEIGLTTRLAAEDVSLANAEWSADPYMASIDHLEVEVRLVSLLFGPIDIERLEVEGVRVLLETDGEGRANWEFDSGSEESEDAGPLELALGQIDLREAEVAYRDPSLTQAIEVGANELTIRGDDTDMLDLSLDGHLNQTDLAVKGRFGPLAGLLQAKTIEHDLSGRFGDIELKTAGRIEDLATLDGADLSAQVQGQRLTAITTLFDLPAIAGGSFQIDLGVRPATAGSDLEFSASVGAMTAKIVGTIDSLTDPGVVDVSVEASGPDVAVIGAFGGVEGLPTEPFDVSGRVRWEGFPVTCDEVGVRVGENSLTANGVIGEPPLMLGTDFTFEGGGPDIASIAALAGVKFPRDSFSVAGRLTRLDKGIAVEGVDVRVGRSTLEVAGTVGDPPEYSGTNLAIKGSGPNLAHFQDLAGIALPAEPFEVSGKLVQGQAAIGLEGVRARLGSNVLQVSGQLTTESDLAGTDLRLNARGPNASQLAAIADVADVPAEPFSVEGRVRVTPQGYRVNDLVATLGSLSVTANGFVAPPPTLVGSDLQLHIEDSDISHPASIGGISGLPHDAFSVDTRLRAEDAGYRLDGFKSKVADMSLAADGLIGTPPELEGTQLQFSAHGPKLASLSRYLDQPGIPPVPFSVSGSARVAEDGYDLDGVSAEIDGNHLAVNGTLLPVEQLVGTKLEIELAFPNLRQAARLAHGFAEIPELPEQPLTLTTRLAIDNSGYLLDDLRAAMGETRVAIDGRVGPPPEFLGTDLTVDSSEPDAALFRALTGVTSEVAPLQLSGRVERDTKGYRFDGVTVHLGDYGASVEGTLGELPKLIGTDVEIHASGPGTGLIKELAGLPNLPDQPFELDGKFRGTPERFAARDFSLIFGPSDLDGMFTVDITGKPNVHARLTSNVVDLGRLRERLEDAEIIGDETEEPEPAAAAPGTLLISDEPIDLAWLHATDANVAVRIKKLVLRAKQFRDVKIDVHLEDGRLNIERFAAVGQAEGRMDGSLSLAPSDGGYRLETELSARQLRLDIAGSRVARTDQPPIDITIDLEAVGATPHELASTANGAMQLVIGKGTMDSKVLDLVTADILLSLLNAFNPFAKQDAATEMQCGVALLSFEDGLATLEPMAFQSDKMTMLGDGKIDLGTEKLSLEWITKPRKGIGISASMITNPYIRLGGTLSAPSVQLKETEAVVSTGAAVATMGLSLVAKGMYDRVTAEKKVCKKALEEIESMARDRDASSSEKR